MNMIRDYTHEVKAWNEGGELPPRYRPFVNFVAEHTVPCPIVEIGAQRCFVSAELARRGYTVLAVDKVEHDRARGEYQYVDMDVTSDEFFEMIFTSGIKVLIARRTMSEVADAHWMADIADAGIRTIFSQSLENEGHWLTTPGDEARLYRACGWESQIIPPSFVIARCR